MAMDSTLLIRFSALAGSTMGALSSLGTTWLTHHAQRDALAYAQATAHRQHLYEEFIEEAAKLRVDALTHELKDPAKLLRLYALIAKLRLLAAAQILSEAEDVMRAIVETYYQPSLDFRQMQALPENRVDLLKSFSEACRQDLLG
jgi:hypothetical protein